MAKKNSLIIEDAATGEGFVIPELRLKSELFFAKMDMDKNWSRYSVLKRKGSIDKSCYLKWVQNVQYLFLMLFDDAYNDEKDKPVKERLLRYYELIVFEEASLSDDDYKNLMKFLSAHMYKIGLMDLRIKTQNWLDELESTY